MQVHPNCYQIVPYGEYNNTKMRANAPNVGDDSEVGGEAFSPQMSSGLQISAFSHLDPTIILHDLPIFKLLTNQYKTYVSAVAWQRSLRLDEKGQSSIGFIDRCHVVLIIGDLNGLGHLPQLAKQIEPKMRLVLADLNMKKKWHESQRKLSDVQLSEQVGY